MPNKINLPNNKIRDLKGLFIKYVLCQKSFSISVNIKELYKLTWLNSKSYVFYSSPVNIKELYEFTLLKLKVLIKSLNIF